MVVGRAGVVIPGVNGQAAGQKRVIGWVAGQAAQQRVKGAVDCAGKVIVSIWDTWRESAGRISGGIRDIATGIVPNEIVSLAGQIKPVGTIRMERV